MIFKCKVRESRTNAIPAKLEKHKNLCSIKCTHRVRHLEIWMAADHLHKDVAVKGAALCKFAQNVSNTRSTKYLFQTWTSYSQSLFKSFIWTNLTKKTASYLIVSFPYLSSSSHISSLNLDSTLLVDSTVDTTKRGWRVGDLIPI